MEANIVAHDFLVQSNQTAGARIDFINTATSLCNFTGVVLENVTGIDIPDDEDASNDLITLNETLNNATFIYEEVSGMNKSLYDLTEDLASLSDTVDGLNHSVLFPIAIVFIILVDLVVIVFMVGVILAWRKQQPRLFYDCTTKAAIPIFLILLLVAYVVSLLALVAATMAADFCIDTPDNQVMEIFAPGDPPSPFDEFLNYYVRVSFESFSFCCTFTIFTHLCVLICLLLHFSLFA